MPQVAEVGTEILRVLCGSRAYGLHTDESDFDYHGVYVIPTSKLLSIGPRLKETAWIEGEDQDNTGWEIKHFLELAIHCNPTVLETFVAPIEYASGYGLQLRNHFPNVLAKKRVYDAFRGYAANQRKKMFEPSGGVRAPERMIKAAISYLRSLYHGVELLSTGTYNPIIMDYDLKQFLLDLRMTADFDDFAPNVIRRALVLEKEITAAFASSRLPEEPNVDAINGFLLYVRESHWHDSGTV